MKDKKQVRVWKWDKIHGLEWLKLEEVGDDDDLTDSFLVTLPDELNPDDTDKIHDYLKKLLDVPNSKC